MRVVVRYRLDDGRGTDAVGELLSIDDACVVVDSKRGPVSIDRATIIAAKEVPPTPSPRA